MDGRAIQGVGLGRARSRRLRCCSRHRRNGRSRWSQPTTFKAALREPALAVDPTSGQTAEQLPAYNAYSIDGDVTAPLVYVNYGRAEPTTRSSNATASRSKARSSSRGTVQSWRGIKPKSRGGARRGRLPDLLGSARRRVRDGRGVSAGPDAQPSDGVQRGSVMDMPTHPGDPLTPGIGVGAGRQAARRQRRAHAHEDSGPADFLRRRAAAARGAGRARRARRSGAAACRSRIASARARRRST